MKVKNAIKKLEKAGFEITESGVFFSAKKPGSRLVEFSRNGGGSEEVVCIRTRMATDIDDPMTDYCAGCWHDTITQAIRFA